MNKKELVASLASRTGLTQSKCSEIVNSLFDGDQGIIASELAGGGKVSLPGFGTFATKVRPARQGTNPATQEPMQIPERTMPQFRAGRNLKLKVRG
ncbi:MAG: HU family DNA-binding protein [Deltaproteobacteria bacterium]|nr:MAG: HU family DNA-binding protein [Deltaproteobacteria bacterium]